MTKTEIQSWLKTLAKTDELRVAGIKELLRRKAGDGMSPEDEAICTECLDGLETKLGLKKGKKA